MYIFITINCSGYPELDKLNFSKLYIFVIELVFVLIAMIDNMDYNIGKVVSLLKDLGIYNNTLIIFTSDNGSSEPFPASQLATTGVTLEQSKAFFNKFDNTLANIGNSNSLVNYADWGALSSVSPFSWFKATQGEGGIRPPFIIKAPLAAFHHDYERDTSKDNRCIRTC